MPPRWRTRTRSPGRSAPLPSGDLESIHLLDDPVLATVLGVALLPALARSNVTDAHYARLRSPTVVRRVHALLRQGSRRRPAVQATTAQLVATARDIPPLPPPTTADH